tara:strand:- start:762 stop:1475 length:714 start_codon:yes stop_codon:yes gene_type:complete
MQKKNKEVKIISEVYPQHNGSITELKRSILLSKLGGASFAKLQLYSSEKLFGNKDRSYLDIKFDELKELKEFADQNDIEIFASIFDEDKIEWCEKLNFKFYKIASRTVENKELCEKIISCNKTTFISLGMYDWKKNGLPFNGEKIKYFYCVSKYPTMLGELEFPNFQDKKIEGYSDHTIGISACLKAICKGATYVEKHFSMNKSANINTELAHVCSMDFDDLKLLKELSDSLSIIKD